MVNNSEITADEAINPCYFCHIVVLQVCLALHGNECFWLVCFFYKCCVVDSLVISSPSRVCRETISLSSDISYSLLHIL